MKRLLISALLMSLLFGLPAMDAAADEVAILICRASMGLSGGIEVTSCSTSAGASIGCPVDPSPDPMTNASCSQALADFLSAHFKIVSVQTAQWEGTTYTLVK
jgi:hypothetical protein